MMRCIKLFTIYPVDLMLSLWECVVVFSSWQIFFMSICFEVTLSGLSAIWCSICMDIVYLDRIYDHLHISFAVIFEVWMEGTLPSFSFVANPIYVILKEVMHSKCLQQIWEYEEGFTKSARLNLSIADIYLFFRGKLIKLTPL